MKYCTNCLEPNTRPTTIFDEEGICLACKHFKRNEKKYDESERLEILKDIVTKYKKF